MKDRWVGLLMFVGCLVVFGRSLAYPFMWDDFDFFVENEFVQDLSRVREVFGESTTTGAGKVSNYYRPVTSLSFAVDRIIWGNNPVGFRLVNLGLHAACAVMLYQVVKILGEMGCWGWGGIGIGKGKGKGKNDKNQLLALGVSLGFLVHPVQVEAVVYINSRGDSFYSLMLLSCVLVALRWWRRKKIRLSWRWGLAVGLLFSVAVLAKEIALGGVGLIIGLGGILVVTNKLHQGRFDIELAKSVVVVGLMVSVIAGGYVWLRLEWLNFGNSLNFYGETQTIYAQDVGVRVMTFLNALRLYVGVFLVPVGLHIGRLVPVVTEMAIRQWVNLVVIGVMVMLGVLEMVYRRRTMILVGLVWFGSMMLPVSGIVPINGIFYEHWLYLPIVGLMLMGLGVIWLMFDKVNKKLMLAGGLVLIIVWGGLSLKQVGVWASQERLFRNSVEWGGVEQMRLNLLVSLEADQKWEEMLAFLDPFEDVLLERERLKLAYKCFRRMGRYQDALEQLVGLETVGGMSEGVRRELVTLLLELARYEEVVKMGEVVRESGAESRWIEPYVEVAGWKLGEVSKVGVDAETERLIKVSGRLVNED